MLIIPPHNAFAARSGAAIVAALVAVGISSGVASAADGASKPVAADPAPFSYISDEDREKMRRQAPLIQAADVIQAAADKHAKADGGSGYLAVVLEQDRVVLRWKGAVPAAVRSAVDGARRDAAVEVRAATHTRAQLKAAEARITQNLTRDGNRAGFSLAFPADDSGVVVTTVGDVEDAQRRIPAVGVPVRVRHGSIPQKTSRLADYPQWWGGARITNAQNGAECSSGFGVYNQYGTKFLLTAGHCGANGGGWRNGDPSLNWWQRPWIGAASAKHLGYDIMLIPTNAGGSIYDGGVGYNEFSKDVVGWGHVYSGEWLCVSGSVTGAVCGLYVDELWHSYCSAVYNGDWNCFSDLVTADQGSGQIAVRPGDSGGPVFNLKGFSGSDLYKVYAKGVISGRGDGGRTVIFQDYATVINTFSVWPL